VISQVVSGLRTGKRPTGEWAGQLYDVASAIGKIATAIGEVASSVSDLIQKANQLSGGGGVLDFVKKAFGAVMHFNVNGFATGGIVSGARIAMVGEDGPEADRSLELQVCGSTSRSNDSSGLEWRKHVQHHEHWWATGRKRLGGPYGVAIENKGGVLNVSDHCVYAAYGACFDPVGQC
jgi:hypothetical protein